MSAECSVVSFTETLKIVILADSIVTLMCTGVVFHRNISVVLVASASKVLAANVKDFRTGQDTDAQSFLLAAVSSALSCMWPSRNARMYSGSVVCTDRRSHICDSSASA